MEIKHYLANTKEEFMQMWRHTDDGNVNWCSYYGKHCGGSSKIESRFIVMST